MLEQGLGNTPTFAPRANNPVRWRHCVGEEDFVEVVATVDLLHGANINPWLIKVDQQVGNTIVLACLRLGANQGEHVLAFTSVRGPHLLPIDDPLPVTQLGLGAQARQVTA